MHVYLMYFQTNTFAQTYLEVSGWLMWKPNSILTSEIIMWRQGTKGITSFLTSFLQTLYPASFYIVRMPLAKYIQVCWSMSHKHIPNSLWSVVFLVTGFVRMCVCMHAFECMHKFKCVHVHFIGLCVHTCTQTVQTCFTVCAMMSLQK